MNDQLRHHVVRLLEDASRAYLDALKADREVSTTVTRRQLYHATSRLDMLQRRLAYQQPLEAA